MDLQDHITEDVRRTAAQCRHYAMCKIDYLGTGICPPAREIPYVSFFPQGRMDICDALAKRLIPVTKAAVDIISSCTLCGHCDKQCHFVTGMRPMQVMRALKDFLSAFHKQGGEVVETREDETLIALKNIAGEKWASNDPAHLVAYSNDPFPLAEMQMPQYVVLPGNAEELAEILRFADRSGIPAVVRGNGGSVFGFVFTDGIVIDVNRMRNIEIDPDNWTAVIEPGVTAFELQKAAEAQGFRVNTAEPAATVCGNIVCTGLFSTWANAYGVGADHFVDMTFVDMKGRVFRLNDKNAPNVFGFEESGLPAPGICTEARVRLHPVTDDEEGILVPFTCLADAVSFAGDLSRRRIGLAVGILGGHYLSTFMSPTASLAAKTRDIFSDVLEMAYVVQVVGDQYARNAIKQMVPCVIDGDTVRMLMLGLPRLDKSGWMDIVEGMESDRPAYETVFSMEMLPVLEALLEPSPETLASAVEEDLRDFYKDLYTSPRMTDMVWLTMFRIVSARMSRYKHMFAFLVYVPLDRMDVIDEIISSFADVAEKHGIEHDFGFITPLDFGKRGILEYDYYIDHTDNADAEKIRQAMNDIEPAIEELSAANKGVKWLKYIFSQGCSRKESYLYT
ncbi:MAG: FAD-binding oxidoreductase [Desulfosalsimonas sp.]